MKRIVVIGNNGSGKSTFSEALSKKLDISVIHLDKYFFKEGWKPVTREEWDEIHANFLKGDRWIIDGFYPRTIDERIKAADTIIFLDVPKWVTLGRIVKRRVVGDRKPRPDLPGYLKEQLSFTFLKKHALFPRKKVIKKLRRSGKNVIILKRSGTRSFLDSLK